MEALQRGVNWAALYLFFSTAAAMSSASEQQPLLRGRRFFVAPVGLHQTRVAIFTTNICNHGGVVVGPADDADAVDYFLAEKSTEKKPIQAAQVRALWKTIKGGKKMKSLHWLEDMLAKRYAPEPCQYPLLSHYHPSLSFPSPMYPLFSTARPNSP